MARRAASAQRRRRVIAGLAAAVGLIVLAGGAIWLIKIMDDDDKTTDNASGSPVCSYQDAVDKANVKDVGKPSTKDVPDTGTATATMTTNFGPITIELDRALAPCTTNSWNYLASKNFFDSTVCPRLTDTLLQCGNPFGASENPLSGGPSYEYGVENLPAGKHPAYPKGTVAMAKSDAPISVGSQFFIMWADMDLSPDYTVVGRITDGMGVLEQIGALGNDGSLDPSPGGGKPNQEVQITTLTVA